MQANSPDEVVAFIEEIIQTTWQEEDRIGYFASLYKVVTVTIHNAVLAKEFEDNERMARMIVTFANRYFASLTAFRDGSGATGPWNLAFVETRNSRLTLLQHLLLGMNAHINFDLGIAAATVAPGDELESFYNDFLKINAILGSLMVPTVYEFGKIWPIIAWGDRLLHGSEKYILSFDMDIARNHAWGVAKKIAPLTEEQRKPVLAQLDKQITGWGHPIAHPPFPLNLLLWLFRITNPDDVRQIIDVMNSKAPAN